MVNCQSGDSAQLLNNKFTTKEKEKQRYVNLDKESSVQKV